MHLPYASIVLHSIEVNDAEEAIFGMKVTILRDHGLCERLT